MPVAKPSILLSMKDVRLRTILVNRFTRDNWKAVGAEDIDDAERKAVRLRPVVFFVELEKAEEAKKYVKHWKSLPTLLKSKIVILLPRPERSHVDEALKGGADQVILSGTLTPKEIINSLERLIAL